MSVGETGSVGPESVSLATFEQDAERALEAISKVGGFAVQYGSLIPGLGQYVSVVSTIEKIINGALTLFKA